MHRYATLLGLLIGLAGLTIDFVLIVPDLGGSSGVPGSGGLAETLVTFWTYFTHLTNLALVLIYVTALTGWRWLGWFRQQGTRAMMVAYIVLVMVFYHFMLAPYFTFGGGLLVATILLHYVAPTFYVLWWLAFARHGGLRYAVVPALLAPGVLYVAWVLVRGAVVNAYPYDILDAGKHGYGGVAIGAAILFVAVALLCGLTVLADRLLAHHRGPGRI